MTDDRTQEYSSIQESRERDSMKRTLRRWGTAGVAGLALSAVLLGGVAFAQTDSTDTGTNLGQTFFERLAEKLGITTDELDMAIDESANEIIDEAVASGRLTEDQAGRLKERVADSDGFPGFGHGPGHHGRCFLRHTFDLDTVAETLGITTDELRTELEAGTELTDIISEHGSTVEAVVDALVADLQAELDEAVADGRLTQEQADAILADLPERLTEKIESGMFFGPRQHHWFDGDNDGPADGNDLTTTTPTA